MQVSRQVQAGMFEAPVEQQQKPARLCCGEQTAMACGGQPGGSEWCTGPDQVGPSVTNKIHTP